MSAVVTVSPAFEAAIRAAVRQAASEHEAASERRAASGQLHAGATLAAQEAIDEAIRRKVRAAAHELLGRAGPPPAT